VSWCPSRKDRLSFSGLLAWAAFVTVAAFVTAVVAVAVEVERVVDRWRP
jgi:hypothetical protein